MWGITNHYTSNTSSWNMALLCPLHAAITDMHTQPPSPGTEHCPWSTREHHTHHTTRPCPITAHTDLASNRDLDIICRKKTSDFVHAANCVLVQQQIKLYPICNTLSFVCPNLLLWMIARESFSKYISNAQQTWTYSLLGSQLFQVPELIFCLRKLVSNYAGRTKSLFWATRKSSFLLESFQMEPSALRNYKVY